MTDRNLPVAIPPEVAICPICAARIEVFGVDDTLDSGVVGEDSSPYIGCVSEPDIESPDFNDHMLGHYSMPYVDWMPVQAVVLRWLVKTKTRIVEP